MRIFEPRSLSGYFWLPSESENRLPGTLKIEDGGSIELELLGNFGAGLSFLADDGNLGRIIAHLLILPNNCTLNIPPFPSSIRSTSPIYDDFWSVANTFSISVDVGCKITSFRPRSSYALIFDNASASGSICIITSSS